MRARWIYCLAVLALGAGAAFNAGAHSTSTAYLSVSPEPGNESTLTWRVPLRDLDALIDLDANGDGRLTWSEVDDRANELATLMRSALIVTSNDTPCTMGAPSLQYIRLGGTAFAQLSARTECGSGAAPTTLDYRLFAGVDASHRAIVSTGTGTAPRVLAPGERFVLPQSGADATADRSFAHYVVEGFGHILGGLDHLLFVILLMLPAVLQRRPSGTGGWVPREDLKSALLTVAGIVTAFTIAHSLTLAAATFGWVRIPAAIIEPLIAATLLATALNNVWPVVTGRPWQIAFVFGLVHGFGFAEVLAPLGLPPRELAFALLGFNLGVELGQLAIVVAAFALLALARHWSGYVRVVLQGGSAALAALAMVWVIERIGWITLPQIAGNG